MVNKKHIYAIDSFLVVATLASLLFMVFQGGGDLTGMIVGTDSEGLQSRTLFSFPQEYGIWIDEDPGFSSPEEVLIMDGSRISLNPGTYYLVVEGNGSSEVRQLTIQTKVELMLRKSGEQYDVVNAGETVLDVDIYVNGEFFGNTAFVKDERGAIISGSEYGK